MLVISAVINPLLLDQNMLTKTLKTIFLKIIILSNYHMLKSHKSQFKHAYPKFHIALKKQKEE